MPSTGRSAKQRSPAGSRSPICCRSSPPADTDDDPASETHSLQPGTAAWRHIGLTGPDDDETHHERHRHRRRSTRSTGCAGGCACPTCAARSHDVVATAKAQRWDPAEVVRVLLDEEARGRDASTIEIRRRRAGVPRRQDIRHLRPGPLLDPRHHPTSPRLTGVGRPPREPRRRRTIRHRQEPLLRSARPRRHQRQHHRHLVQRRTTRRARRPSPHRRQHHQSAQAGAALGPRRR